MRCRPLAVVLLLALAPAGTLAEAAEAPDTQIGDWVFRLPEAMRIVAASNGQPALAFRATPDNLSTSLRFAHSSDLAGPDAMGAFRAWAREGREALARSLGVKEAGELTETRTPQGYDLLAWAATYQDQRSVRWIVILSCLRREARAGGVMFFTNDFQRLRDEAGLMDALLASTTFASLRPAGSPPPALRVRIDPLSTPSFLWEPPPALPTGTAGLEGLYGTSGLGAAGDPREGITTARYRWTYYAFFADGRVMRVIPPEGLFSFRFEYWQQRYPADCGRYVLRGDVVDLAFRGADGREEAVRLQRVGAELREGTRVYRPVEGEAQLQGRFLRVDAPTLGPTYQKGIEFAADGTFRDEGFNGTINVGWWVGGDCVLRDIDPPPGVGRWRVARNTLELLYQDGRRRRFAFHRYADEPAERPRLIVLNGNVLTAVR